MSEERHVLRLTIGGAFPAEDPVARFVTVIAMMSNDVLRLLDLLINVDDADGDAGGLRVMLFRYQAALLHEAAAFITSARTWFPAIDAFVAGLPEDGRAAYEQVAGATDPRAPQHLEGWVEAHRNVTFHYPEMHPDKAAHGEEELMNALADAAGLESYIVVDRRVGDVRFAFADEVATQLLPKEMPPDRVAVLREAVLAVNAFAMSVMQAHISRMPAGTFTPIE